jgi:hypothetical protein
MWAPVAILISSGRSTDRQLTRISASLRNLRTWEGHARASADELWEAAIHDRARLQEEKRSIDECYPNVLVAELDRCLAELTNEVCNIQWPKGGDASPS